MSQSTESQPSAAPIKTGGAYAHYVLAVLVIVYVFNFIDRNILSILSQEIQKDLGVSDAEMGFLYGTVFARCLGFRWLDSPMSMSGKT